MEAMPLPSPTGVLPAIGVPFFTPMRLLLYGGVLILAIAGLGLVVLWTRRRYYGPERGAEQPDSAFSIEALEEFRRAGEISEEEFRSLRHAALGLGARVRKNDSSASSFPIRDDEGKTDSPRGDSVGE